LTAEIGRSEQSERGVGTCKMGCAHFRMPDFPFSAHQNKSYAAKQQALAYSGA
jgi:hypothetical protein